MIITLYEAILNLLPLCLDMVSTVTNNNNGH